MLSSVLRGYLRSHRQALTLSLAQLRHSTFSSTLLILVISIAFSLPIVLWMLSTNLQALTHHWPRSTQLSMFVEKDLTQEQSLSLLSAVRMQPQVEFANYISPDVGLQTLEEQTGMDNLSTLLKENPLPAVIEVHPLSINKESIQPLVDTLKKMKGSREVQVDMQWLLRLDSILILIQQSVVGLMILLCFAVVLVVGNTIRLAVNNRKKEIKVLTLIGATNAYIRRPFLYFGSLYGFLGALFAWIGLTILMLWLQQSINHIARLYYTHFHLIGMTFKQGSMLLFLGAGLGFMAAFFSVNLQFRQKNIEVGF